MTIGDIYTTNVNINGRTVYSSRYSPCCYSMNSCFGYPMFGMGMPSFEAGLGFGVGMAAGNALIPALPAICKGIGKAAAWVGNGIKNLWNSIFHKKSKTKKA